MSCKELAPHLLGLCLLFALYLMLVLLYSHKMRGWWRLKSSMRLKYGHAFIYADKEVLDLDHQYGG